MNDVIEKSSSRVSTVIEDCPFWCIVPTAAPTHLAINRDGLTLAVCVNKNNHLFAEIYDIKAFANLVI